MFEICYDLQTLFVKLADQNNWKNGLKSEFCLSKYTTTTQRSISALCIYIFIYLRC